MVHRVIFSAEQAASALWDYGEDQLVERALALTDADLRRGWSIAGDYWFDGDDLPVRKQRVTLNHVNALAAIAVIEGRLRPLAQERRRPQKGKPESLVHVRPVDPSTRIDP